MDTTHKISCNGCKHDSGDFCLNKDLSKAGGNCFLHGYPGWEPKIKSTKKESKNDSNNN